MRAIVKLLLVLAWVVFVPAAAYAQSGASIAGVVKDTSGSVLPGVTVEASSPALIEKTRTAVTDGAGQYQIVALLPGIYTVTFTLPGFSVVKREGVELTGTFVASINAEMRVGAIEETVTVTGQSPLVDVQSTSVQRVITKEVVDTIPTGRLGVSLAALTPGMITGAAGGAGQGQISSLTVQDVGAQAGDPFTDLSIHGSRPGDMKTTMNGVSVATQIRFGESTSSAPSMTSMQEVSVDTSGNDATTNAGGVRLNYVPREGGNTFRGMLFITGANQNMRASNYDDKLKARGLGSAPPDLKVVYDVNPGFGGPIKRDKLWFFFTVRAIDAQNYIALNYPNLNAGRKDLWTYVPDTSKPQSNTKQYLREETMKLTWQATSKNKFGFYYVDKYRCSCLSPNTTTSPDAVNFSEFYPFSDQLIDWTSPLTNKLLLEAGIFRHQETWGGTPAPANLVDPTMIGVTLQSAPPGQNITTYRGRVGAVATPSHNPNIRSRFTLSYVTGSHNVKTGFDQSWAFRVNYSYSFIPYSYGFTVAGVPNSISLRSDDFPHVIRQFTNIRADGGAFVQDKWTKGRLTLSGGLRLDWFNAYLPEQSLWSSTLTPNRDITFAEYKSLDWKDITPKMGMAYDLFGDGRTALKVSLGKYVLGQAGFGGNGLSDAGPAQNVVNTTTRAWTDANGNFVIDCGDLSRPGQIDNRATGGDFCGPFANQRFGSTQPATTIDDDIKYGWNKRQYNWELAVSAQHEVGRGVSVYGGYFRRWYGNFYVTDNLAISPADYDPFSITAPLNPLLPDGGGYLITDLHNLTQAAFLRSPDNFQTFSRNYGNQSDQWNGFDFGLNARMPSGVIFQGGLSSGFQALDNCEVRAKVPESGGLGFGFGQRFCHVDYPWLTQVKFLSSYTIPRVDVQIGATFQTIPGFLRSANYNAPNSVVSPSLNRPLSGGVANVGVQLIEPGMLYGDRLNQLDLRFGKVLRFGRTRSVVSADIFNALNSNAVTNESTQITNWQTPANVMPARLLKLTLQMDF